MCLNYYRIVKKKGRVGYKVMLKDNRGRYFNWANWIGNYLRYYTLGSIVKRPVKLSRTQRSTGIVVHWLGPLEYPCCYHLFNTKKDALAFLNIMHSGDDWATVVKCQTTDVIVEGDMQFTDSDLSAPSFGTTEYTILEEVGQ